VISRRKGPSGALGLTPLLGGHLIANVLIGCARENAPIDQIMFVAIRATFNNLAGGRAIDAWKIQELALGSGVEVDERVLAIVPAFADTFRGGASLVGRIVGSFAEFSSGVLDLRLGALGGLGNFVAGFFVACALVGIIAVAAYTTGQDQGC
jgi:hypothetical protein